jgi:hypothetical protein
MPVQVGNWRVHVKVPFFSRPIESDSCDKSTQLKKPPADGFAAASCQKRILNSAMLVVAYELSKKGVLKFCCDEQPVGMQGHVACWRGSAIPKN